jgi:hypothetical protein
MPATAAPTVTATIASAVLVSPTAVAVLDLASGLVTLVARPGDAVWEDPSLLVLITHADAVAAAPVALAAGGEFRAALAAVLNADLAVLHAAGEIPTPDEVAADLAELAAFDAELAAAGGVA